MTADTAVDRLRATLAALEESVAHTEARLARQYVADLYPPDGTYVPTPADLDGMLDGNGRSYLLDARVALVTGYAALARATT